MIFNIIPLTEYILNSELMKFRLYIWTKYYSKNLQFILHFSKSWMQIAPTLLKFLLWSNALRQIFLKEEIIFRTLLNWYFRVWIITWSTVCITEVMLRGRKCLSSSHLLWNVMVKNSWQDLIGFTSFQTY